MKSLNIWQKALIIILALLVAVCAVGYVVNYDSTETIYIPVERVQNDTIVYKTDTLIINEDTI